MRRLALAAAFAFAAVALFASAASGAPALAKRTFPAQNGVGARDFYVSVPDGELVGLVVFLHGCTQTVADVAVGTHFHEIAGARGLAVVYHEQALYNAETIDGNGGRCWNWFLPPHQSRGAGEPASIAGIAQLVAGELGVPRTHVFVAGISAGADMTTVLGATYPDVFAAIAPYSGCAYLTCADVSGAAAVAAMGQQARVVPALVAQGTADVVNNAAMGDSALRQWVGTNDLVDDGSLNGSVGPEPTTVENHDGVPPSSPGGGDPCVAPNRFPCASAAAGAYPYTVSRYESEALGSAVAVEHWLIHGLNHAWPGGDPAGTFTDPAGPDLATGMIDFFLSHPMPGAVATAGASARPDPLSVESGAAGTQIRPKANELPATGAAGGRAPVVGALAALAAGLVGVRRVRTVRR